MNLAQTLAKSYQWVLLGMFAFLAAFETMAPRRRLALSTARRWFWHFLLYLASSILFPVLFGAGSVALASARTTHSAGLLNRPEIPYALRFTAWILVVDLWNYGQHYLLHGNAWLWRVHLLHHSDRDMDFTNQFRFHPLEGLIARLGSVLAIFVLAPPAAAVAVYEVLAVIVGMLEHANLRLPAAVERLLRWLVITPELHQIHHSLDEREQHRNLGVVFVWWDRLFGTYLDAPAGGIDGLEFGVDEVDARASLDPLHMLAAPFQSARKATDATVV
jgi:sterol desaturase/sphingolipid hydroxylase (fatty acid hydroxylase superfamily)